MVGLGRQPGPAAGGELPVCVCITGRRGDRAVGVFRALQIARAIDRRQHLLGELAGGGQHRLHGLEVKVREGADQAFNAGGFHQAEGEITDRGAETHGQDSDRLSLVLGRGGPPEKA